MVMDFKDLPDMQGAEMPRPSEMLSATQKDGRVLQAKEIYEQTWDWLNKRGCVSFISPQMLERYAMAAARWKHCEEIITATGYLAKHPTTGGAIASPYVSIGQNYLSQANRLWNEIFSVIRENTATEYSGPTNQNDFMEQLLRSREKRK
nr:MAG TPA: terminase small subunit [Caudoviricetes sp.]DAZ48429.1 MAG TPA: terminase small subunit [Caudoviricetes sp.]